MKKYCFIVGLLLMTFSTQLRAGDEILLETIGVLSGQSAYLTYIAIGATADAYSKGVYEKKLAKDFFQSYINTLNLTNQQMKKLAKTKHVRGEDIGYVRELILINELLIKEAQAYKSFMDTGSKKDGAAYERNRKAAWKKISKILGLE